MKIRKNNLDFRKILFLSILIMVVGQAVYAQYVPPVIDGYTHYNKDYYDKMVAEGKPTQESPWGFREINIEGAVEHNISSIDEYLTLYKNNTINNAWSDGKTHIINFAGGEYILPTGSRFIMQIPSRTIIKGAGIGKTIFKATTLSSIPTNHLELRIGQTAYKATLEKKDRTTLFAIDNCDDVVLRDFSFYNETKDNKWFLLRGIDTRKSAHRENFLFENIEFDDTFGAFGNKGCDYNFVTFRGLRKKIGNTTKRIKANYDIPIPSNYQFAGQNDDNVELAGQVGMRHGNSVVFHDCVLGDNISATIDTYNNYIEIVGVSFINPLHDHSIKCPSANHLYVHDSQFELRYLNKIINNSYYNPTFFTHEGGTLANYHFKNLSFTRAGQIRSNGTLLVESEPLTMYDNRYNDRSGDMVWENIQFSGYDNQIVGYPNVQSNLGFQAINYTGFTGRPGQLKNHDTADFTVAIEKRTGNSKTDITGVYSWGQKTDGSIDFPRDNRTFEGTKSEMESRPYVRMHNATVKTIYNKKLTAPDK